VLTNLLTTPLDTVRARYQLNKEPTTTRETFLKLWNSEKLPGLYKGRKLIISTLKKYSRCRYKGDTFLNRQNFSSEKLDGQNICRKCDCMLPLSNKRKTFLAVFCTKFDPLNDFFKIRTSYHFKASSSWNLEITSIRVF